MKNTKKMKIDFLRQEIQDFIDSGNTPLSFYIGFRRTENILCQRHGKYCEMDAAIEEAAESELCIEGDIPIERLIVYSEKQCIVFSKNRLWDCVNDDSDDSHTITVVPYIAIDGCFGRIVSERSNGQ